MRVYDSIAEPTTRVCTTGLENAYVLRDANVQDLGFPNYRGYLTSDTWKKIREGVLARDKHRCQACGQPATECHHLSYQEDVLKGLVPLPVIPIVSICRACHEWIEFDDGKKVILLEQVNDRFRERVKQFQEQAAEAPLDWLLDDLLDAIPTDLLWSVVLDAKANRAHVLAAAKFLNAWEKYRAGNLGKMAKANGKIVEIFPSS